MKRVSLTIAALTSLLIVEIVFFSVTTDGFLSSSNLSTITAAVAAQGIVALGVSVGLAAGALDLSITGVMAIVGVVVGSLAGVVPLAVAIACGLGVAILVGAVNGGLMTKFDVNPLVTTLAIAIILRGVAFLLTGVGVPLTDATLLSFGRARVGGVAVPFLLFLAMAVGIWFLMARTKAGRALLAVGGNPIAARIAGLRVRRLVFVAYLIVAASAGIGGIVVLANIGAGLPATGTGRELSIYAAVLLGGANLWGGKVSIGGTVLGITTLGVLFNGLVLLGTSPHFQQIAEGSLLIIAIAVISARGEARITIGRRATTPTGEANAAP